MIGKGVILACLRLNLIPDPERLGVAWCGIHQNVADFGHDKDYIEEHETVKELGHDALLSGENLDHCPR
jgi:hypothetical protein